MENEVYYVKSLEEDFATKTLKGEKKVVCQTIQDIIKTKIIQLNTKSFGREKRLSCTILHPNYSKTYRPQGVIFKTSQNPDYIIPFDLALLTATDNIIVHYYRIKDKLHIYYNHSLIKGFERFIFKDINLMIKNCNSPSANWEAVNKFRKENGFKNLPMQKFRLAEYNEVVFHKPVKIEPVALFGYRKEGRKIAKELGLAYYKSAKDFVKRMKKY